MATSDNFLMVVAMDFGTAYSGYAYSFKHDPTKIIADIKWVAGASTLMSLKTPTCILLNPQKEFDSFGYDAENHLIELAEKDELDGWYFFEHFKMALHNTEGLKRDTTIEDVTGKSMPALTIIRMSIEYLKNHFLQNVKSVDNLSQDDIRFVITVPAIWDDTAKQFMREAAIQAGIDGNKLKIALEPEAASIWCQSLPIEKIHDSTGSHMSIAKTGTQYMVVDLGDVDKNRGFPDSFSQNFHEKLGLYMPFSKVHERGCQFPIDVRRTATPIILPNRTIPKLQSGTVDITVHEKQLDGTLKELYSASGGPWGGNAVNSKFKEFLASIVGQDIMTRFAKEQTEDLIYLMREFETKKRAISSKTSDLVTIKVPVSLKELFEESGRNLQQTLKTTNQGKGLKWTGDKCRFDSNILKSFIEVPCRCFVQHLKDLLSKPKLSNVSTILLVGGFAECKMIQEVVEREFGEMKIQVPAECGLAVLKGAVLFGHKPTSISSRVSRFTYGTAISPPFDAEKHPEKFRYKSDGGFCCNNIFDVLVAIGEDIPIGYSVSRSYRPVRNAQMTISAHLYLSTSAEPKFVTDSSCCLLGTHKCPLVPEGSKSERGIIETIIFGDTELQIQAKQKQTGKVFSTYFDLP